MLFLSAMTLWLAVGGRKRLVTLGGWWIQWTLSTWEPALSTSHPRLSSVVSSSELFTWDVDNSHRAQGCEIGWSFKLNPVHSNLLIADVILKHMTIAIYRIIIFLCCGCRFLPPTLDPNLHNYISVIIQAFPRLQIIINLNPHYVLWRYYKYNNRGK